MSKYDDFNLNGRLLTTMFINFYSLDNTPLKESIDITDFSRAVNAYQAQSQQIIIDIAQDKLSPAEKKSRAEGLIKYIDIYLKDLYWCLARAKEDNVAVETNMTFANLKMSIQSMQAARKALEMYINI